MMIDAPGFDDDEDKHTSEDIVLTEDNAESVMRYFSSMIS